MTRIIHNHAKLVNVRLERTEILEISLFSVYLYIDLIHVIKNIIVRISENPFKGSQLGAFYTWVIVYCYVESKLRYLKHLKLFSIRVKELFEPIVLQKKVTAFCSF